MPERRTRIHAPELETGGLWLNTPRPLRLSDLRGKLVLLDFWTHCCINCHHVLTDLTPGIYTYVVTARNLWGESARSNEASSPPPANAPADFRVTVTVTVTVTQPLAPSDS